MIVKAIIDEDFNNYKQPSMFIGTCCCDWKCAKEGGFNISICQNSTLTQTENIDISNEEIYQRYINNSITKAIVVGGLEPMLQFDELYELIQYFRNLNCLDNFVIYTGYYDYEIQDKLNLLARFPNIIVKFGRFIPNQEKHYDEVLGVYLASDNQYAEKIS